MASIQFSGDAIAPVPSLTTASAYGGVYSKRDLSVGRTHSRPRSEPDIEDDVGDLKRESDLKKRQDFDGWTLLW